MPLWHSYAPRLPRGQQLPSRRFSASALPRELLLPRQQLRTHTLPQRPVHHAWPGSPAALPLEVHCGGGGS